MVSLKFITKSQRDSAYNESLVFQQPQTPIYAPHFVMYIKDLLVKKYGLLLVEKGGLSIITSLNLKTQNMAQDIVKQEVDNNAYLNLTNGAALITNPKNGDILAMVGSKDYDDPNGGNVNVTTSLRQPGSSIKLVTYSAALSNGFTAATILDDSPITYNVAGSVPYSPVNYDGGFHGKIPLRIAFANSFNVPAVKTLAKIGIPTMVNTGKKKIISLSRLKKLLSRIRRTKAIVFTNGCFDIIHAGHVRYLNKAKSLGDILVVGLNSDSSVKNIKGEKRPIVPQRERAEVLSGLEAVDYVVFFNEPTPIRLIKAVLPDILVKGADWASHAIVGADVVKAAGGKIARVKLVKGRSTTNIIEKILELHQ